MTKIPRYNAPLPFSELVRAVKKHHSTYGQISGLQRLIATLAGLRRNRAARNRHQPQRARHDMRTWQVERRKRTQHLIELGGLVVKAGIANLTGDDLRRSALDGRQAPKRAARTRTGALDREGERGVRRQLSIAKGHAPSMGAGLIR